MQQGLYTCANMFQSYKSPLGLKQMISYKGASELLFELGFSVIRTSYKLVIF